MAINQHLFLLTPVGITPVLDNEGWHYGKNFVFPVFLSEIEKILGKYLKRESSWSPGILSYRNDGIMVGIFLKDGQDDSVESINVRVSLSKFDSLDRIMKIANILKSISQEIGLKLFDPYKKKIVETKKDIVNSICTSRPGKLYGYEKYVV